MKQYEQISLVALINRLMIQQVENLIKNAFIVESVK